MEREQRPDWIASFQTARISNELRLEVRGLVCVRTDAQTTALLSELAADLALRPRLPLLGARRPHARRFRVERGLVHLRHLPLPEAIRLVSVGVAGKHCVDSREEMRHSFKC